jgi:hypothetical protein
VFEEFCCCTFELSSVELDVESVVFNLGMFVSLTTSFEFSADELEEAAACLALLLLVLVESDLSEALTTAAWLFGCIDELSDGVACLYMQLLPKIQQPFKKYLHIGTLAAVDDVLVAT